MSCEYDRVVSDIWVKLNFLLIWKFKVEIHKKRFSSSLKLKSFYFMKEIRHLKIVRNRRNFVPKIVSPSKYRCNFLAFTWPNVCVCLFMLLLMFCLFIISFFLYIYKFGDIFKNCTDNLWWIVTCKPKFTLVLFLWVKTHLQN